MDPKLKNFQSFGAFGILQETIKLIYQWKKIFTQITLAFILPSYILTFANMAISIFILDKTKPSNNTNTTISSQSSIYYLIFNLVSSLLSAVFILLSTATVVYTVACIYAGRDVSFKHVIGIVPKVWKRLLVTFLCVSISLFGLIFVAMLVLFLIVFSVNDLSFGKYTMTIVYIFMTILFVGALYLMLIWQLSKVVAVLEELCGFKAMAKSKALVKGKMRMVIKLYLLLSLPIEVVQLVFSYLVLHSTIIGFVGKCILVIIWTLLVSVLLLLVTLVAQTLLYFVCKSFHHEIVLDKSLSISDRLQRYLLADYDPLKVDDDVRTEKLQIV